MKINTSSEYSVTLQLVSRVFCVLMIVIPTFGYADEARYIEQGREGIEAFRQGNLIMAIELLGKSAEKGYAPAQTTLAYIMDQAEENDRAFELFEQAAKQNNAAGQFGLGNMYAKGEGVGKDPIAAGYWIKKSALQHYAPAMRAYAYALEFAHFGFEKDLTQAFRWYYQCHDAADRVCTRRLAQGYDTGDLGQPADENKAGELRRQLNQASQGAKNAEN